MTRNRLHYAFEQTFPLIARVGEERGMKLLFRIKRHPIHGDSPAVSEQIAEAVQRNIANFRYPHDNRLHIKIGPGDADLFLRRLPLDSADYGLIASEFIRHYDKFETG